MILQIKRGKELNNRLFFRLTYLPKVMDTTFVQLEKSCYDRLDFCDSDHTILPTRPMRHRKDGRWSSFSETTKPTFTRGPFSLAHLALSCSCDKYSLPHRFHKFWEYWDTRRHLFRRLIGKDVLSVSGMAVRVSYKEVTGDWVVWIRPNRRQRTAI